VFTFRKKVLNPLISEASSQIDETVQMQRIPDRIEGLLTLKENIDSRIIRLADIETAKSNAGLFALVPLAIASVAFCPIAPVLAPMVAAIALLGTAAYTCKKGLNSTAALRATAELQDKIDTEANKLATAYPTEAAKSQCFIEALKKRFNLTSAGEPELDQLRAVFAAAPLPGPSL
jgi:hypothetical protein